MGATEISKALAQLPVTVLLLIVLIGGYVEWWIYGSLHRREIAAREKIIEDLKKQFAEDKEERERTILELREEIKRWQERVMLRGKG